MAAVLIAAACLYKVTRTYDPVDPATIEERCPVTRPLFFLLPDQHQPQRFVKLEAYLGRHRVLLVFYDAERGAERNPVLVRLRRDYERLEAAGVKVFGVSTAIPQENRPPVEGRPYRTDNQPREEFPFPLLTDLSPACRVHRQWGRFDAAKSKPLEGVFLIDRSGNVACSEGVPRPVADPEAEIDRLVE
jgi:peroxiredoxin